MLFLLQRASAAGPWKSTFFSSSSSLSSSTSYRARTVAGSLHHRRIPLSTRSSAGAQHSGEMDSVPAKEQMPGGGSEVNAGSTVRSGSVHAGSWYAVPDLWLRDCHISVPLNHAMAESPRISLFVREVAAKKEQRMPYLLFLQGGPGFESPRPVEAGGWLKRACKEFRVILLDQRGTGLSTPLTTSSLSQFESSEQQAEYLQHFRADSIVKDAEYVRAQLVPDGEPWTLLGQSYGGFCAVTYLSFAPAGLKEVLLTGGLPPVGPKCTAELVYRSCFKRVLQQNKKFYGRFPEMVKKVQEVVLHLDGMEHGGVPLPSGGKLSPRGLQLLGLSGLGLSGGFERLHYLFERAWDPMLLSGKKKQLSSTFLRMFENWLPFDTNPLYAVMHESIYCQGAASNWAAQRVRDEFGDQFDAVKAAKNGEMVLFTGEMIFPWMFDEMAALQPLKEVANILASKEDWPPLYDKESLNSNKVRGPNIFGMEEEASMLESSLVKFAIVVQVSIYKTLQVTRPLEQLKSIPSLWMSMETLMDILVVWSSPIDRYRQYQIWKVFLSSIKRH